MNFGDGSTSTSINPSHTFTTPGTYPVTLKIKDVNNCVDSVTQNITVSAGPLVEAGSDAHICPTGSQLIGKNASGGVPPYSYSWTPAGSLSSASIAQPAASPSVTTTYTLTVTDAMGCFNSDDVTVFVEPAPTADAGTDQVTCGTEPVVIGMPGSGGTPPYTYAWNPPIYLSDPNIMQPTARPNSTTTYTVTVTDANGCTGVDDVTVTIQEKPFAIAGPDRISCAGDSIMIGEEAVGGTPPYIYAWSPAQGLSATDIAQPMAFPAATTTYTLTVTDANGCSDDAAVTITVVTLPPLTINGLLSVCPQTTWPYR